MILKPSGLLIIGKLLYVVGMILFSSYCLAGEDQSLSAQSKRIYRQLIGVLIETQVCKTETDCRGIVFVSPATNGLGVAVYGVTERHVIAALVSTVIREAEALPSSRELSAEFIPITKQESLRRSIWSRDKRILEFSTKGGQYAEH